MAQVIRAAPTDWWEDNWKWIAVAGALAATLAVAGLVFVLVSFASGSMRGSEPFQHAVAVARASPAVGAALGQPIRTGVVVSGRISTDGDNGAATLSIPLHGPRGASHVRVEAQRTGGLWSYQTLEVQMVARQQEIDLLQ